MVVITGATGTVGTALLEELAGAAATTRVLVRDRAKAPALAARGFDVVHGSLDDAASMRRAFRGADRLFLLSPPGTDDMVGLQVAAVDAARAAGVRHVVKLSSIGADEPGTGAGIIAAHRRIEEHIERSGLAFTHLRPHWFFQNELGHGGSIATEGRFYAPDVTRISAIDARDIAAVAALVLTQDGHEGAAYTLTGPQALGYAEMAAVLSRVLGHTVRWAEVTLDQARSSMVGAGLPPELASGFTEIMRRYREGGVTARVSPAAGEILGRPPRSFEQFATDHRAAFAAAAAA
jgi:uncharacterized protein YbjT (DUF2867 family)